MRILVIGATGLIGRALCQSLTKGGHTPVAFSRSPRKRAGLAVAEVHQWEYQQGLLPDVALAGVEAVVNLAGNLSCLGVGAMSRRELLETRGW